MPNAERHRSIKEGSKFIVTHRSLSDYQYYFQFDAKKMLPNARVLDIGSGINQELASGIKKVRPDIQVVSIDPSVILPTDEKELKKIGVEYRLAQRNDGFEKRNKRLKTKDKNLIAGLAPNLPIKSASFDYIFDSHGPFLYFSDDQSKKDYIQELLRVGGPSALIGIFPLKEIAHDSLKLFVEGNIQFDSIENEVRKRIRLETEDLLKSLSVKSYELFEREDLRTDERADGKSGFEKVGLIIRNKTN